MIRRPPRSTPLPYTTLFRSWVKKRHRVGKHLLIREQLRQLHGLEQLAEEHVGRRRHRQSLERGRRALAAPRGRRRAFALCPGRARERDDERADEARPTPGDEPSAWRELLACVELGGLEERRGGLLRALHGFLLCWIRPLVRTRGSPGA